ncbi:hypothetical protein HQQ80_07990 [Microbacteriaceae bacterium VKM Ac-2855]|nr:hypothetical protein [Microbacteriaceae bacterium VKM Ac-2855]
MIPRDAEAIRAAAAVSSPDPFPPGASRRDVGWLYAPGDYELGVLHRLVRDGFAANRFVHYADNHAAPSPTVVFRHRDGDSRLVSVPEGEAAALRVPDGTEAGDWSIVGSGASAGIRWGGDEAPHRLDEPMESVELAPHSTPGVFTAPATVLGRPVFRADGTPRIVSGESLAEALADGVAETRHELVARADGRWTTRHRLGFRYLRVIGAEVDAVTVEASIRPIGDAGAFVCSDDLLNRIWGVSAYTIRLCLQGLVLDGVKRDRMPWIGDQALNTISNAYSAGDGGIVRDGLVALGRVRHGYVNGIADYSLWWLIDQELYQRYFGDHAHLASEAALIDAFVSRLADECGEDGVLRPGQAGFAGISGAVLIDWGVRVEAGRDLTALQVLWRWALQCAASLLARVEHPGAGRWAALAETLARTLRERAWDPAAGAWREYLDPSPTGTAYPNFLAVLSGMDVGPGVVAAVREGRVGTPFMTAFSLRALAQLGESGEAMRRVRRLWGPILEAGATTFWEEFTRGGESPYAMYGRPFGKSLAHAWGAGPAALLPELVLGVRPEADGWAAFSVAPELGDLSWASAVVSTPYGSIVVVAEDGRVTVDVPAGTRLLHPPTEGPARVSW